MSTSVNPFHFQLLKSLVFGKYYKLVIGPPNGVLPVVVLPLRVLAFRIKSVERQLLLYVAHSIDVPAAAASSG